MTKPTTPARESPAQRMALALTDGKLPDLLGSMRRDGLSWERIASRLHARYGIDVGPRTLRVWAASWRVKT